MSDKTGIAGLDYVCDQEIRIRLELPDHFPSVLPVIYVEPWDALGFIPHVEDDGKVCYFEDEGLVIDRHRPLDILMRAFDKALDVLEAGYKGDNSDEFAREFDSYWSRLEGIAVMQSLVNGSGDIRRIIWARPNSGSRRKTYLAETESQITDFLSGDGVSGDYTVRNAIYIPLTSKARIKPPRSDRPFWTHQDLRDVVWENLMSRERKTLKRYCKKCSSRFGIILLGIPKPDGTRSLVGIQYSRKEKGHPLLDHKDGKTLRPLHIERLDFDYLVPRGGGNSDLAERKVLLVGCGAIGGHIAVGLVQSGVMNCTLVDSDDLRPENTFRHVLGRLFWNRRKTDALQSFLRLMVPYVSLTSEATSIEDALEDGKVDFADFDLVIFATGSPVVELEMNERNYSLSGSPPVVHAWLEPHGIGGHAFLTGNANDGACFECLYQSETGNTTYNRASFAKAGQSFGKTVSGCGGLFTPYGAADAVRTANTAVRLAVDALTGKEDGNPLISWKGRSEAFEDAGYKLSHRFSQSERQLRESRYSFRSPRCPVCSAPSVN